MEDIDRRLARLLPYIVWPDSVYATGLDTYGTFLRSYYTPEAPPGTRPATAPNASSLPSRSGGTSPPVAAAAAAAGPRGMNLQFRKNRQAAAGSAAPPELVPSTDATPPTKAQLAGHPVGLSVVSSTIPNTTLTSRPNPHLDAAVTLGDGTTAARTTLLATAPQCVETPNPKVSSNLQAGSQVTAPSPNRHGVPQGTTSPAAVQHVAGAAVSASAVAAGARKRPASAERPTSKERASESSAPPEPPIATESKEEGELQTDACTVQPLTHIVMDCSGPKVIASHATTGDTDTQTQGTAAIVEGTQPGAVTDATDSAPVESVIAAVQAAVEMEAVQLVVVDGTGQVAQTSDASSPVRGAALVVNINFPEKGSSPLCTNTTAAAAAAVAAAGSSLLAPHSHTKDASLGPQYAAVTSAAVESSLLVSCKATDQAPDQQGTQDCEMPDAAAVGLTPSAAAADVAAPAAEAASAAAAVCASGEPADREIALSATCEGAGPQTVTFQPTDQTCLLDTSPHGSPVQVMKVQHSTPAAHPATSDAAITQAGGDIATVSEIAADRGADATPDPNPCFSTASTPPEAELAFRPAAHAAPAPHIQSQGGDTASVSPDQKAGLQTQGPSAEQMQVDASPLEVALLQQQQQQQRTAHAQAPEDGPSNASFPREEQPSIMSNAGPCASSSPQMPATHTDITQADMSIPLPHISLPTAEHHTKPPITDAHTSPKEAAHDNTSHSSEPVQACLAHSDSEPTAQPTQPADSAPDHPHHPLAAPAESTAGPDPTPLHGSPQAKLPASSHPTFMTDTSCPERPIVLPEVAADLLVQGPAGDLETTQEDQALAAAVKPEEHAVMDVTARPLKYRRTLEPGEICDGSESAEDLLRRESETCPESEKPLASADAAALLCKHLEPAQEARAVPEVANRTLSSVAPSADSTQAVPAVQLQPPLQPRPHQHSDTIHHPSSRAEDHSFPLQEEDDDDDLLTESGGDRTLAESEMFYAEQPFHVLIFPAPIQDRAVSLAANSPRKPSHAEMWLQDIDGDLSSEPDRRKLISGVAPKDEERQRGQQQRGREQRSSEYHTRNGRRGGNPTSRGLESDDTDGDDGRDWRRRDRGSPRRGGETRASVGASKPPRREDDSHLGREPRERGADEVAERANQALRGREEDRHRGRDDDKERRSGRDGERRSDRGGQRNARGRKSRERSYSPDDRGRGDRQSSRDDKQLSRSEERRDSRDGGERYSSRDYKQRYSSREDDRYYSSRDGGRRRSSGDGDGERSYDWEEGTSRGRRGKDAVPFRSKEEDVEYYRKRAAQLSRQTEPDTHSRDGDRRDSRERDVDRGRYRGGSRKRSRSRSFTRSRSRSRSASRRRDQQKTSAGASKPPSAAISREVSQQLVSVHGAVGSVSHAATAPHKRSPQREVKGEQKGKRPRRETGDGHEANSGSDMEIEDPAVTAANAAAASAAEAAALVAATSEAASAAAAAAAAAPTSTPAGGVFTAAALYEAPVYDVSTAAYDVPPQAVYDTAAPAVMYPQYFPLPGPPPSLYPWGFPSGGVPLPLPPPGPPPAPYHRPAPPPGSPPRPPPPNSMNPLLPGPCPPARPPPPREPYPAALRNSSQGRSTRPAVGAALQPPPSLQPAALAPYSAAHGSSPGPMARPPAGSNVPVPNPMTSAASAGEADVWPTISRKLITSGGRASTALPAPNGRNPMRRAVPNGGSPLWIPVPNSGSPLPAIPMVSSPMLRQSPHASRHGTPVGAPAAVGGSTAAVAAGSMKVEQSSSQLRRATAQRGQTAAAATDAPASRQGAAMRHQQQQQQPHGRTPSSHDVSADTAGPMEIAGEWLGEAAGKGQDSRKRDGRAGAAQPVAGTGGSDAGTDVLMEDPAGTQRVGGDTPLQQGMHSDGLSFLAMSMMQFSASYVMDSPRVQGLKEEGRKLKRSGDKLFEQNGAWTPMALTKYIASGIAFFETAGGYEPGADRDPSIRNSCCMMLTETANLLQTVCVQADILRKASLLSCLAEDDAAPDTSLTGNAQKPTPPHPRLTLDAIRLLALKLSAVCLTKWVTLNAEGLSRAMQVLEPAAAHGSGLGMGGGGQRSGPASVTTATTAAAATVQPSSRSAARPAGERHEGGGSTDGLLTACLPPTLSSSIIAPLAVGSDGKQPSPAADSASSTLEAACGPSGSNMIGALSTISECLSNYGKASDLWGMIATTGGAFVSAAAESGDVACCLTAARLQSMGYEGGVWDLMGTAHIARKALESIHSMPGFA